MKRTAPIEFGTVCVPLLAFALLVACSDQRPTSPDWVDIQAAKGGNPGKPGGGGDPSESTYDMTHLGALDGNTRSSARGMNGVGQIVGSSWGPDNGFDKPTHWTLAASGEVTVTALEMPAGALYAAPYGISNSGITVGGPWFWDAAGNVHSLPGSGPNARDVALLGDGSGSLAVGETTDDAGFWDEAVYWTISAASVSGPEPLPPLRTGAAPTARAVNSSGTIAGMSSGFEPDAVLWHKDSNGDYWVCNLGLNSFAKGISESTGDQVYVAGATDVSVRYLATVWHVDLSATTWTDPPESCSGTVVQSLDFYSEFFAVNANGEAVGVDHVHHKAIFITPDGNLVYLPGAKKSGSSAAYDISNDGSRIVGRSTGMGSTRGALWTLVQ